MENGGADIARRGLQRLTVVAMGLANFTGASIADAVGYPPTFVAGFVLSGLGCLVLVLGLDRHSGPGRLQPVWRPA